MTKQEIITKIKNEMSNRRHIAEVNCDAYIEKLKLDLEFKRLFLNYNIANLKMIKAKHIAVVNNTEVSKEAKEEFEIAKHSLDNYLTENKINPSKLRPQYKCKKCEDKGIVNGKMCKCLSDEINKRLSEENSTYNKMHTFNMINQSKMNENSNRIFKEMFEWCNNFPNNILNINLFGSVGTGKTFLLECITSKLRERGFNVIFITAFALNEECRKYHFSQSNNLENILNCDALIIDDLGTEPVLKNITTEYFYNIINLRQINNKATLVSSNLNPLNALYETELIRRYTERTISRMLNKALSKSYVFNSVDKRTL